MIFFCIVNKAELMSELLLTGKGLEQIDILSGSDEFVHIMKEFQKEAKSKFEKLEELQQALEDAYNSAVVFYGENPEKIQLNEFFRIFQTFIHSWKVKYITISLYVRTKYNSK